MDPMAWGPRTKFKQERVELPGNWGYRYWLQYTHGVKYVIQETVYTLILTAPIWS